MVLIQVGPLTTKIVRLRGCAPDSRDLGQLLEDSPRMQAGSLWDEGRSVGRARRIYPACVRACE